MLQSVIRRHLACEKAVRQRFRNVHTCQVSATKIQAAWRGFLQFSNYLIIQWELIRMQAAVRGHIARRIARLRLGCIIILQGTMRRYLAQKRFEQMRLMSVVFASMGVTLREQFACNRLQMFLRDAVQKRKDAMQKRKEKTAALKIVRFFRMVKKEVDREVLRCEKKRQSSRSHSRGEMSGTEESLLLKVAKSPMARYRNANRPAMKSHDARPTIAVHVDDADDISVLTTPSVFKRPVVPLLHASYTKRELGHDLILGEGPVDAEIHQVQHQWQIEDEYIKRHGLQERGSLQQHPNAPYGGPLPVDPCRVQGRHASSKPLPGAAGRRTPQFAPSQFPEGHYRPLKGDQYRPEHSTPPRLESPTTGHPSRNPGMRSGPYTRSEPPQFPEGHHWSLQGAQYRPEHSTRPRCHPSRNPGMSSGPHMRSEPPQFLEGHHWPLQGEHYRPEHSTRPRLESLPTSPPSRNPGMRSGPHTRSEPHYPGHQSTGYGREREQPPYTPPRGYSPYMAHNVMYSTSQQIEMGTPRLSNPPRRQDTAGYEEFQNYPENRKMMV